MPRLLTSLLASAASHSLGRSEALGASGSGSTLNPGHLASIANTEDGRFGNGADPSAWTHVQALTTAMGYMEGPACLLGPFANNLLAFWTARGGVVTYTSDGVTGGNANLHAPSASDWKMGRRSHTAIQNSSGTTRTPAYEFTDPVTTASSTLSLIYGQTVYHTLTPYIVFRGGPVPSAVKIEIQAGTTEGGASWETIFDAQPVLWKGIWRGPVWRFASGAHAVFGVRFTFTLPSSASLYELLEIGLASNFLPPGGLLWASPHREHSWNHTQAFLATTPFTVGATTLIANLNADLLDGQHGSFYQSASNLTAGTLPAGRLPAFGGDVSSTAGSATLSVLRVRVGANAQDASAPDSIAGLRCISHSTGSTGYPTQFGGGIEFLRSTNDASARGSFTLWCANNLDTEEFYWRKRDNAGAWGTWRTLWHSGHQGASSGMDADLLDGLHASDFVTVTGNQTIGGTKTFSSDILVNSSGTQTVYHTGNLPQNRLVPPGGTTGQALTKSSYSDYAVEWSSVAAETANRWATARTITLGTDLTGNTSIDGSANVTLNATIANGAVTLAKLANIATARLLGRVSAGSGVVEELTAAQVKTLLAIGIADVSGLQTALDGKAAVSHTHSAADITSGTLASARLSGSYTGITAVGSLSSLTVGGTTSLTGAVSASNLGTDLSSGTGYKLLMRADSGYGIRAITLSGVKDYLDFQIADIPGLQTALDAKVATSRSIATQHSLQGGGSLTADRTLSLVGDSASPGNSKYYGTNGGGTRGYHDLPTGQNVIAAARFQIHTPDDDSVSLVQSGDSGSNRFDPTTGSGQLYFTRGGVVRDPVVYEYHFSNPGSAAWYAVITPSRESYTGGTYNAPTNALAPAVLRDSSSNTECHFSLGSPFDGEWDYVPKWIDIVILKA